MEIPTAARLKLERCQQEADDAKALVDAAMFALKNCEGRAQRAANARNTAHSDEVRAAAERQLEDIRAEHERLTVQRIARQSAYGRTSKRIGQLERWLAQPRPGKTLRTVPQPSVKDDPEALRVENERVADLRAKRAIIVAAPLDRASDEQQLAAHIRALYDAVEVRRTGQRSGEPVSIEIDSKVGGLHRLSTLEQMVCNFSAATGSVEKGVEATVRFVLDKSPSAEGGMSATDRAAALERIDADLLTAERRREALIVAAEAAGRIVERDPAADPRAVLGLSLVSAAAAEAA